MNKNAQYLSIVAGNDFELTAKISSYDVDNSAYTDFDLTGCSQLCLFLVAVTGGRRYKLPVTIDGNILTADIDGSMLNVGVYGLELLFEDAESKSKRSYEPALLKIVRTNAEATYDTAEFDSEDDCRLHMTIQANASFITIGAPTADTQIDATSYNAVSNAAVADAINNLQTQIDSIGSEILDPASVYSKAETEALVDTMIDPQELADYVNNAVSYYTTTEQFDNSYNSLSERITAIEDNPVDLSSYVSKEELNAAAYLQSSALDGMASESYVTEQIAAIPQADLSAYVSKEELNAAAYLQASALDGLASESYVTEQIAAIPQADMSAYVSKEELNAAAYLQSDDLSDFATKSYVSQQIEAIPDPDLSGYATQEFVSQQIAAIPQPDLSTYITETELINTLSSYAQLADLISNERVVSTALNSLADRIEVVEGDYVSDTELDETLLPYATESYVVEKIDAISPADLTEYCSKQYLSQQGYITAGDVAEMGYITAEDVSSMGYATTQYVTTYVNEQISADLSGYVSRSELSAASYLQSDALNGLATESYVVEKIDSIAPADLTEYVSKNFLSQQGYITAGDVAEMGYLTESDLAGAGYVTATEISNAGYVTATEISNAGYVTATEISNAGYVTATEISNAGYVTATEISNAGYVTATEISNAGYVTATEISNAGYVTATEISNAGYVTATEISNAGYVTATEISNAGYITANDVAGMGYVTTTNLNTTLESYVSKSDLNAAAYITANDVSAMGYLTESDLTDYVTDSDLANAGYVTTTALNTALSSYAKVSDIEDNEQVISTALNTLSDRIGFIENDYVSDDDLDDYATKSYVDEKISGITPTDLSAYVSKEELNAAAYLQADDISDFATKTYVTTYVTDTVSADLSAYVSKEELNAAAYLQADDLADYVTATDLANASYVTNTALNTALSSYTTKADVPYKFVVLSYADYTALSVKDQNTIYMIPEE